MTCALTESSGADTLLPWNGKSVSERWREAKEDGFRSDCLLANRQGGLTGQRRGIHKRRKKRKEDARENKEHAKHAQIHDDLKLNVAGSYWKLVPAIQLHKRRSHCHQKHQNQDELLKPVLNCAVLLETAFNITLPVRPASITLLIQL